jgi:hypothetical protein
LVIVRIIKIIIITIASITLVEGARIPSSMLLGSKPIVVIVDEVHVFPCFVTIVSQMIISATHLAPGINFNGSCDGMWLNGLLFLLGTFFYLLCHEVHFCREHVHLINGVHTSFWLEVFFIPSLIDHHLFDEVIGTPHIVLEKCPSSSSI